jgi:hypothetical protein
MTQLLGNVNNIAGQTKENGMSKCAAVDANQRQILKNAASPSRTLKK